ncbi:N-formylglutamate amidohydrolase [Marivita hallyeonensis]|uniref:Predicted N-formylglutamate amidohydrolase n=1 Tax=Marivita hallyeonensis TaxID=996342 RepID=A0A1M5U3G5_9RHOB|nr:N-formylglutamate amidohydrolase [Marivita hallyeonensis]SHH57223.1 Predicted N-formylglutamate amidohydrolase [Marivita hallyeonensis]
MDQVNAKDHTILTRSEGPAAEVINPGGTAPICLVCEHASSFIPASLQHLGLSPEHRKSHAAWDIGAMDLAVELSVALNAPLVASRVSRLVYDCNRPPSAQDAIPAKSEVIEVPGNAGLSENQRAARVAEIYDPFRQTLVSTLDTFATPPAVVTIHSFTPVWHGKRREVELGFLHDADDRLATLMLAHAPRDVDARLNAPYSADDGVTHTLREHAIPRRLQNVMIEVRNDMISDASGVARFSHILGELLTTALMPQEAT